MPKGTLSSLGGRGYPMTDRVAPMNGGFLKTKKKPPNQEAKASRNSAVRASQLF